MTMPDLTRRTVLDGAFDVHSLRVGPFRVHRVADIDRVKWPATAMFRALSGEALVRAAARTPAGMVDVEGSGRFLEALDALSFPADRIDVVINTHLHADHVGWNTRASGGEWVPTFPRARYVTPKGELAYWSKLYEAQGPETLHGAYVDSVVPLLAHGKLDAVETPCEIVPGLRLEPASGHAPGMCVVRLDAAGTDILFLADVVHHPLQLSDPDTTSNFCMDPMMATATRRRILDECAARGTIVAPYHFPSPVFGRFRKAGVGFDYVPL
jgi:glyoxylase-like metal-dependent hydrolase (beta-lactamase superfamily II)